MNSWRKKKSFFVDNFNRIRRLCNLEDHEKFSDKEFRQEVKKYRGDVVKYWKRKYNYSSNDPRYTEATLTQIYEDFLDDIVHDFNNEFEDNPLAEEILQAKAMNPEFMKKESEAFKNSLKHVKIED